MENTRMGPGRIVLTTVFASGVCMALSAAEDDKPRLGNGSYGGLDIRLVIGNAVPITDGDIEGLPPRRFVPRYDQQLDVDPRLGYHLGVQASYSEHHATDNWLTVGWSLGLEAAYDGHRGTVDTVENSVGGRTTGVDEDIYVDAASISLIGGAITRFDFDGLPTYFPRTFQAELRPYIGIGSGVAGSEVEGTESEGRLYWKAGVRLEGAYLIGDGVRLGLGVGYERFDATVDWTNTWDSTLEGDGIYGMASLIYEL